MDSDDPKVVQDLVDTVKYAIRTDGFLFLENYGVSLEQLHRQFALAQYLYEHISEEDKERLLFDPDSGKWSGYKHPFGFKVSFVLLCDIELTIRRSTRVSPTVSSSSTGTPVNGQTTRGSQSASCPSWTRSERSARCVIPRPSIDCPVLMYSI
jgi:isopenicillin N synthase-like dioxygenase